MDINTCQHYGRLVSTRVVVALTKGVGMMWTTNAFVVLAVIGLFAHPEHLS